MSRPDREPVDVIIIGGGHNGLVAAAYLAGAGLRVEVLEACDRLGGAVASSQPFAGVDVSLSRYSYLVSLLPASIMADLGLALELRSRPVASYTPYGTTGLLVEREPGEATWASLRGLSGGEAEAKAWRNWERRVRDLAAVVEPTLTGPLPRSSDLRLRTESELWEGVVERPLGELVEASFADDVLRGLVLTDGLIGIDSHARDPTLRQNRCFLYHVIGRGTGEWRVPVGGMGAVASALERAALGAGARLRTGCRVTALEPVDGGGGWVSLEDGERLRGRHVLANCAPSVLATLLGSAGPTPVGAQTKINMVLRRLPRFRSGIDPEIGFAGTLHLGEGYARLAEAYAESSAGQTPDPMPCEVYCHSLTDRSILGPQAAADGYHTLTLFGLHTPADLFRADPDAARDRAGRAGLAALQAVLDESLEDCLARDADGRPCVEVKTPLDIEAELGMPGGHIFHGDLAWPWLGEDEDASSAAARWGVATDHDGILLCGSGSRRGGAVSGLGGHSAAMAVLEELGVAGE